MVLGGGGAIGSAVVRYTADLQIETHAVVRNATSLARLAAARGATVHRGDLADARSMRDLVAACQPDLIVNAAFPSGQPAGDERRRQLLHGMADGLLGLFTALRDAGFVGRVVLLGSAMSYGRGGRPRRTSDVLRPQTFRGAAKAAESALAAQLAGESGIAFTELRIFTGYGPFEQRERLIPQLLRAALGGPLVRLTAEPFRRDWVFYDDIARACLASDASTGRAPAVFNVCSGVLNSTHEVARALERIVGRELVAAEPFEPGDRYGDAEPGVPPEAAGDLDWTAEVALQQGLARCWAWATSPEGAAYLHDSTPVPA